MRRRREAVRLAAITGLGSGFAPVAPGTWGSAVAVLLFVAAWYASRALLGPSRLAPELLGALGIVIATWLSVRWGSWAVARFGRKDPSAFTLDEFAGQWVALLVLPVAVGVDAWSLAAVIAGQFVLFRIFDILKPPPARQAEALIGGWGIVADDLFAGLYANIAGHLLWGLTPLAAWLGVHTGPLALGAVEADILRAVVLGVIEGLTEFLPVSSTGHMVIARPLLGVDGEAQPWKALLWVSQFAAILAVIVFFWRDLWNRALRGAATGARQPERPSMRRLLAGWRENILTRLAAAMAPTVVLALLLKGPMDALEERPTAAALATAVALILGAAAMEYIDRRFRRERPQEIEDITLRQAFLIGLIQCLSMWPGVSRAAATIMGGMVLGLTPRVATEFSFYLAIPTMLGAALVSLHDARGDLTGRGGALLVVNGAVSFLVALAVVSGFLAYVKRFRFTPFAVYRVILGGAVLAYYALAG